MSFQFVNVTPNRPEPDAANRKRIRSQAMRDFRRRQKLEGESSPPSNEGSPQTGAGPGPSSSGQPGPCTRRSSRAAPVPSAVGASEGSPGAEDMLAVPGRSPQTTPGAKSPQRRGRTSSLQPPPAQGTFGTFTVSLPPKAKPATQPIENIDPLKQPGQLDELIKLCENFQRWLLSGIENRESPVVVSGPWDNASSQMLLLALSLKSMGHLEALNPGQRSYNRRTFKIRVLVLANKRLKNPAKALEDQTLGALACLTSYEISRGSTEAMMHLHGMSQIIKLRGGTEKIRHGGGLYMYLEILDLLHAVYFNSTTMYTCRPQAQEPIATSPPQPARLDEPDIDDGALEEISNFHVDLQDLTELDLDESLTAPPEPEPAIIPASFEQEVQSWYQYLVEAANTIAPSEQGSLAYACRLAAGLHLATTSAIAPPPLQLQVQRVDLFNAMLALPDGAWFTFETLPVRVLLTGMAASIIVSQKSWYNAHLTRQLYRTELENWGELKGLVLRFIDMQAATRQPRTQAVRALVNDIEIVVDPAEAWEQGLNLVPPGSR